MMATPTMAPMAIPALAPVLRPVEGGGSGVGRAEGTLLPVWLAPAAAGVEVEELVEVVLVLDDDLVDVALWMRIWPFLGLIW